MPNNHSKLPPSSASRRVACPGSRRLEELYPGEESEVAKEGHAAHEWASACLHAVVGDAITFRPHSYETTEEMREGAELYADHIHSTLIRLYGIENATIEQLHIEEKIDISSIHPDCWGTPDCWLISPNRSELHIWDYKYGHKFVEVFENWQLIEYAAGILDYLGVNGLEDQIIGINFHIVQPRSFHRDGPIRSWRVLGCDLRPHFNVLRSAEAAASEEKAVCIPSPECTYCTGRHACEALQRSAMDARDMSAINTPLELTPAATGQELRMLRLAAELLDARITGLEEQAKAMLSRGDRVPYFRLEQGYGRDRWTKDAAEIVALGQLFGHNLAKPLETITPKQAIKAGMDKDIVAQYFETPKGALKLVADEGITGRKVFGGGK